MQIGDSFDCFFGLLPTLSRLESSVPVDYFSKEVFDAEGKLRFSKVSEEWPHREGTHVYIRSAEEKSKKFYGNRIASVDSKLRKEYPLLMGWVLEFARRQKGSICRVVITELPPHTRVYRHADRGYYYAPRDRYHLVLRSDGGTMRIAGKEALLRQGEVWWINNKAAHESYNDTEHNRTHLIVDILPHSNLRRIVNSLYWIYLGLRPKRLTNYYFDWPKRYRATS